MLKGELADLMEEIELENKDFKKNVFFSNFHELSNHLGIFDEVEEKKIRIIIILGSKVNLDHLLG